MTTNATQKSATKYHNLPMAIDAALDIVQAGKPHKEEVEKFFLAITEKPIEDALKDVLDDLGPNAKVRKIAEKAFKRSFNSWTPSTATETASTPNRVRFALRTVLTLLATVGISVLFGLGLAKLLHHLDPSATGFGSAAAIGWLTFIGVLFLILGAIWIVYELYVKYIKAPQPVTT